MTHVTALPHGSGASPSAPTTAASDTSIEPVTQPPAPAPFKPGVGTWLGTAFGTMVGGALGFGAGAGLSLLISRGAPIGTVDRIIIGALAVGGAIAGGDAWFRGTKTTHAERERADAQREFGTSTLEVARGMMMLFDHDDDGRIDLDNASGSRTHDERLYVPGRLGPRDHPNYATWNSLRLSIDNQEAERWRQQTADWRPLHGGSAAAIWDAANADGDSTLEDTELARLMSGFDADGNGAMNDAEIAAFNAEHRVLAERYRPRGS